MSPLKFASLVPHPPLLIQGIGDEEKKEAQATHQAYQQFAARLVETNPSTVVVITPHGPLFADAYTILAEETLRGDFTPFGSVVAMTWPADQDYIGRAEELAAQRDLPLVPINSRQLASHQHGPELDHGTMLPLWYLKQAGWHGKVVCIRIGGLAPEQCYEIGKILGQAGGDTDFALVASGDLSHCLTEDAPSPYNPAGIEFDQLIVDALAQQDYLAALTITPELRQRAAECGWRPLVTLLGALDGRSTSSQVLSYQGPFGVGYLVATFDPGPLGSGERLQFPRARPRDASPHVRLARQAIRHYLETGQPMKPEVQPPLDKAAGAFVSLKLDDQLRGCIGTIHPEQDNLAEEIATNAVSAAGQDPRFEPVTLQALDQLIISVDVLSHPEPASFEDLDPAKLGLIAQWQGRSGLLLPDLPGVDSAQEQLKIVCAKAGIPWSKAQEAQLHTFSVERYH